MASTCQVLGGSRGGFWEHFGLLCQVRGACENLTKTAVFLRFLDVPRICQNGPKCSQNPPQDPPKPDKLKPKSDQDLPSWGQDGHPVAILALLVAILVPSWPILVATLCILAPALLQFFRNSSLHRVKVRKIVPRAPPDLHFFDFWSLRRTIFVTFRVAFSLFSSLLSIFGSCFNFSFKYVFQPQR